MEIFRTGIVFFFTFGVLAVVAYALLRILTAGRRRF
jgi:hypothetical protein